MVCKDKAVVYVLDHEPNRLCEEARKDIGSCIQVTVSFHRKPSKTLASGNIVVEGAPCSPHYNVIKTVFRGTGEPRVT